MIKKPEHGIKWESFIKIVLNRLDIPTKGDIIFLNTRLDKLEQLLFQKQPAAGDEKTKPSAGQKSASSIVLDVFKSHPKGTNFKTVKAATGFNDKKLRNIIFRLEKIKKIKRVKRGIYKKA